MLEIIDKGNTGLLVLLDLSAAFDLIDHQTLTDRLYQDLKCSKNTCDWVTSFLTNRQSKVCWENAESDNEKLLYGVPQGSCLSPALFNAYMVPLFVSLEQAGIQFTNYADDTQLLFELTGNHAHDSATLQSTYNLIKSWMDTHWMCLNGNKTELMVIGSPLMRKKLGNAYSSFKIDLATISVVDKVKTLGVYIDASLSMTTHTANLSKTSHYYLRLLRQIRPYLSESNSVTLARAIILPRLDYCNILLANTAKSNIRKLQVIQNEAVRIATSTPKRQHITEKRKAIHWLPIEERIHFKVLTTTYKIINNLCPAYLTNTIQPVSHQRNHRSNFQILLKCPKIKKNIGNGRSIKYNGPKAWNQLPADLRKEKSINAFKKKTKTLIFR